MSISLVTVHVSHASYVLEVGSQNDNGHPMEDGRLHLSALCVTKPLIFPPTKLSMSEITRFYCVMPMRFQGLLYLEVCNEWNYFLTV